MHLDDLAESVGMSAGSGTFRNYVYVLRKNALATVDRDGGTICASGTLFGSDQ